MSSTIKPAHYAVGSSYEHYRVVEAWALRYCPACAVKYITRAGKKPGVSAVEDYKKAIRYLQMEIDNLEHRAKTSRSKA